MGGLHNLDMSFLKRKEAKIKRCNSERVEEFQEAVYFLGCFHLTAYCIFIFTYKIVQICKISQDPGFQKCHGPGVDLPVRLSALFGK